MVKNKSTGSIDQPNFSFCWQAPKRGNAAAAAATYLPIYIYIYIIYFYITCLYIYIYILYYLGRSRNKYAVTVFLWKEKLNSE